MLQIQRETHCLTYDKWGGSPCKHTHLTVHVWAHMIYTQSEFVYHHHSMCLKMFGLEYLVEYISTTVGQRAPPISTTYLIFKKNGVLICHVIYMILGFIYIWIWISRVVYRQRLITFYCLSCSNTPCQISQEALWTLQQYFSFCLFVFMYVVHVCVCSRCQRTALSVFLQEFCQFNFKIFFFSLACKLLYGQPICLESQESSCFYISSNRITLGNTPQIFFNVLAHELRSSCL